MTAYKVEPALPSDVATIVAVDMNAEPDPFRHFMEGTANAVEREANLLKYWTRCIESPAQLVLVARDEVHGELISYAQWELPKDREQATSATPPKEEEKAQLREKRAGHIRPGQNGPLLLEWWTKVDELHGSFGSEPLYYLNALRTLPTHRGQGLASELVKQVLDEADAKGLRVGLYTDGDGKARALYERMGFKEAGRFEIKLEEFGRVGRHLEISMIRSPAGKGCD